jgi:hypothetical protein
VPPNETGVAFVNAGEGTLSMVDFVFSSSGIKTSTLPIFSGAAPKFDWLQENLS